jgi:hypothetical protein
VDALKPFRFLTPFHYYSAHQPITNGFNGIDVLVLLGISLVALLLALATFERRDLAT